jgi:hypothetical protein
MLFILGSLNIIKTTAIVNVFMEFYGVDSVILINTLKNFSFQNIENKRVVVLDEFKYYELVHNEYFKLFEN